MFPVTIFYKISPRILSLLKIDNAISKRSREVQVQLAPRGLRKDGIAQLMQQQVKRSIATPQSLRDSSPILQATQWST